MTSPKDQIIEQEVAEQLEYMGEAAWRELYGWEE